ncbi:MAG: hypothetical protein KDA44_02430 [Planctomycetales bacterium]|nr:hypothetical protein [Planctomycetales bacterium]
MSTRTFQPGDWVIYRLQKVSASPGPRAQDVVPAAHGEEYSYLVDKFWVVDEVLGDGKLRLRTRRGKTHVVAPTDRRLRRPRWWEKWLLAGRFQAVESGPENDANVAN